MGLAIEVGALASLRELDPEGAELMEADFEAINRALRDKGLPEHREPRELPPDARWSADMYGYAGLHYLRRIAAHLAHDRPMPEPGRDDAADDPLLDAYFTQAEPGGGGWLARLRKRPTLHRDYDHLIVHADAEGYYVPVDFASVLFLEEAGGMVGSSQALLRECDRLAGVLGIPPNVDSDDEELWTAAANQGSGTGWRRYGIESFTCARLRDAARRSVATGAAILFA